MSHRLVKTCLLINKTWCVRYMTQNMCNFVFEIEEVKKLAGRWGQSGGVGAKSWGENRTALRVSL